MNTLFDIEPALPGGFSYETNFISVEEETQLVKTIEQFDLKNMQFHEYEAKRKVISFGKGWSFTEQQLKAGFNFFIKHKYNVDISAGVDNLLNVTYSLGNDLNASGGRFYNAAPLRNYFIGIAVSK